MKTNFMFPRFLFLMVVNLNHYFTIYPDYIFRLKAQLLRLFLGSKFSIMQLEYSEGRSPISLIPKKLLLAIAFFWRQKTIKGDEFVFVSIVTHSVHSPPLSPFCWVVEPTKFSKKGGWGVTGSQFQRGVAGKEKSIYRRGIA